MKTITTAFKILVIASPLVLAAWVAAVCAAA